MKTLLERFESRIHKEPGGCWLWTAHIESNGYGRFYGYARKLLAHRWSYETFKGPILSGFEIDHLCRNRACVNPEHLEAVPHQVNVIRGVMPLRNRNKTHCAQGHPFTPENTWIERNGSRHCRICNKERQDILRRQRGAPVEPSMARRRLISA